MMVIVRNPIAALATSSLVGQLTSSLANASLWLSRRNAGMGAILPDYYLT
jgi:hypothetical protein